MTPAAEERETSTSYVLEAEYVRNGKLDWLPLPTQYDSEYAAADALNQASARHENKPELRVTTGNFRVVLVERTVVVLRYLVST